LLSKNMYQHTQLACEQRTQLNECGKGPWQAGCGSSSGVNAGAGCGEGGRYDMYRRIFGEYIATCRLVRRGRAESSVECDLVTFHRFPPMPIDRGRYGLQTLGNSQQAGADLVCKVKSPRSFTSTDQRALASKKAKAKCPSPQTLPSLLAIDWA